MYEKLKMIKKYTQEEFKTSEIFKICEEIYLNKFFLENEFSLDVVVRNEQLNITMLRYI